MAVWLQLPCDHFTMLGSDAAEVLHKLCSNDVLGLEVGDCCEAFACTVQGKIVGHLWATRLDNGVRVQTTAGRATELIAHLDRYVIREDVTFEDESDRRGAIMLIADDEDESDEAAQIAEELFSLTKGRVGEVLRQPQSRWEPLPDTGTADLAIRRGDWAGRPNLLVSGSRPRFDATVEQLQAAGVTDGNGDYERLRIEAGFPLYGRDITDGNLPQEVGRDELAISFTKGCYLGQEPVARIDAMGHVNWSLGAVVVDGEAGPLAAGTELFADDKVAGRINVLRAASEFATIASPSHSAPRPSSARQPTHCLRPPTLRPPPPLLCRSPIGRA